MADVQHYTRLEQSSAAFNKMIQRFGVVTVMNAYVWDIADVRTLLNSTDEYNPFEGKFADEICKALAADIASQNHKYRCRLDTLKTSNITQEGPTKTITGGQNSSPLLKFGKTARLEMQDALGNAEALEALGGMTVEYTDSLMKSGRIAVHASDAFSGPKTILGESFFIDQDTGAQVDVYILIYQFVPDSIFNLTQDAEGDATVFDMNGDLIASRVKIGTKQGGEQVRNLFYSVCDKHFNAESNEYYSMDANGVLTIPTKYTATLDGSAVVSGTTTLTTGTAGLLIVSEDGAEVYKTILSR